MDSRNHGGLESARVSSRDARQRWLVTRDGLVGRRFEMWKEFKEFAMRGNVLDMAVGIIIGAAFGTIVSSL